MVIALRPPLFQRNTQPTFTLIYLRYPFFFYSWHVSSYCNITQKISNSSLLMHNPQPYFPLYYPRSYTPTVKNIQTEKQHRYIRKVETSGITRTKRRIFKHVSQGRRGNLILFAFVNLLMEFFSLSHSFLLHLSYLPLPIHYINHA